MPSKTRPPLTAVLHMATPDGWKIESDSEHALVVAYLAHATHPVLGENPIRSAPDVREHAIGEANLLAWCLDRLTP